MLKPLCPSLALVLVPTPHADGSDDRTQDALPALNRKPSGDAQVTASSRLADGGPASVDAVFHADARVDG